MPVQMRNTLNRATQLEKQIETAIEDLRRNYGETLRKVAALKKRINDLELNISERGSVPADPNGGELNSAVEELDEFIDSVILQTARTREKCEKLKHECAVQSFEPIRLRDLLSSCLENERLAKDLLCYSLGRLRK